MPEIKIDETKCSQCGLCAKECVSGVIRWVAGKAQVVEPSWCNRCSHCVAVCPAAAVIHEGLTGEAPRPIRKDRLDPAVYQEIVMTRRSVRWFQPEPLNREEIENLLDLARYSPTASNTMDVAYIVITDRELIRRTGQKIFRLAEKWKERLEKPWLRPFLRLAQRSAGRRNLFLYLERLGLYQEWTRAGRDLITHHAPLLIIIHGPKNDRFSPENCAIAAANLTNYAHALGLGTCYIGFLVLALERSKKLRRQLGLPPGRKAGLVVALGRPLHRFQNTPRRPAPLITWK